MHNITLTPITILQRCDVSEIVMMIEVLYYIHSRHSCS